MPKPKPKTKPSRKAGTGTLQTSPKPEVPLLFGQVRAKISEPGRIKRIAIVGLNFLSKGSHPHQLALASYLARRPDWQVVFMAESSVDAFKLLTKTKCDGVLARVTTREEALIARKLTCSIVNFSTLLKYPGVPTVRRDDRGIGRMCARHLLERGYSRFGIVEVPYKDWCFQEIEGGFLEVVRNAGRPVVVSNHTLDADPPGADGVQVFREWLRTLKLPAALFLISDRCAPVLMEACRMEGLHIPRDIAVIAGGAHPESVTPCRPTLTQPQLEGPWLMDVVCDMLDDLMKHPGKPVDIVTVPHPGLVAGDSTRVLVSDDSLASRAVAYMDANFRRGINIADVMRHLGCSRRLLERHFIAAFHRKPHDYLVSRRVEAAQDLMAASPGEKLGSIARECGFGGYQSFRLNFRALTGCSPTEWRG